MVAGALQGCEGLSRLGEGEAARLAEREWREVAVEKGWLVRYCEGWGRRGRHLEFFLSLAVLAMVLEIFFVVRLEFSVEKGRLHTPWRNCFLRGIGFCL